MDLQSAFSKFFKENNVGYPKYKSKKYPKNSYKTMQTSGYLVTENDIKITKLGKLKIVNHRHKTGIAKSCTISLTPTGDFYIAIL